MDKESIKAIVDNTNSIEDFISDKVAKLFHQHGTEVSINVLVNLSSHLLAKALLLANDHETREKITYMSANQVQAFIEDGSAAINTHLAINKAMGVGLTCRPLPPKKR
jgi:hypothetical protein